MRTRGLLMLCIFLSLHAPSSDSAPSASPACRDGLLSFINSTGLPFNASSLRCAAALDFLGYSTLYGESGPNLWSFVVAAPSNASAYVGVGFSPTGRMVGASAVVGWAWPNGTAVAKQYELRGRRPRECVPDAGELRLVAGSTRLAVLPPLVFLSFQLRDTPRPLDRVIYAAGPPGFRPGDDLLLVEHQAAQSTILDYDTGQSVQVRFSNTLKTVHGIVGMTGWGVLVPLGIVVARYAKRWDPAWFYSHLAMQSLGYALGIATIATGLKYEHQSLSHVRTHKAIGILVIALGFLQMRRTRFGRGRARGTRPVQEEDEETVTRLGDAQSTLTTEAVETPPPELGDDPDQGEDPTAPAEASVSRRRGKAKCTKLTRLRPGERIRVEVTRAGQALGDHAGPFSSRLGIAARMHVPVVTRDFRSVGRPLRDAIIADMKAVFDWGEDPDIEAGILQRAGKIHRDLRARGKRHFDSFPTVEEARANPPLDWHPAEWEECIRYWGSAEFMGTSGKNKLNRQKAPGPTHSLGRKSLDQLKHTHAVTGEQLDRVRLYEMTRKTTDRHGNIVYLDIAYEEAHTRMRTVLERTTQAASEQGTPDLAALSEAAFREVYPPSSQHSGRVLLGGASATKTAWFGRAGGSSQAEMEQLRTSVRELTDRSTRVEEALARSNEREAELLHALSEGRRREEQSQARENEMRESMNEMRMMLRMLVDRNNCGPPPPPRRDGDDDPPTSGGGAPIST